MWTAPLSRRLVIWLCLFSSTRLFRVQGFLNSDCPSFGSARNHSPLYAATTISTEGTWQFPLFSNGDWMKNPFSPPKQNRMDWTNPFSMLQPSKPKVTRSQPTFFDSLDHIGREFQQFVEKITLSNRDVSSTLDTSRTPTISATETLRHPTPIASEGDWSAFLSPDSGNVYYFHHATGESRWEPPTETFPAIHWSQIAPGALPKGFSMRKLRRNMEQRPQHVESQSDWSQYMSPGNKVFYYHRITGKSQWDPPRAFRPPPTRIRPATKPVAKPSPRRQEQIPLPLAAQGDWSAHWDPFHRRAYYFHRVTGESVWEPPVDFPMVRSRTAAARKKAVQDSTTTSSWDLEEVTKAIWTSVQDLTAQWETAFVDPSISTRQMFGAAWSIRAPRTTKQSSNSAPTLSFANLFSHFHTLQPTRQTTQRSKKSIPRQYSPAQPPFSDLFKSDRPSLLSTRVSRAPSAQHSTGTSFPHFSLSNGTRTKHVVRKQGTGATYPFFAHAR